MGAAGAAHTGGPGVAPVSNELLFPLLGILAAPLYPLAVAVILGIPEAGGMFTVMPDAKTCHVKSMKFDCALWPLGDWAAGEHGAVHFPCRCKCLGCCPPVSRSAGNRDYCVKEMGGNCILSAACFGM